MDESKPLPFEVRASVAQKMFEQQGYYYPIGTTITFDLVKDGKGLVTATVDSYGFSTMVEDMPVIALKEIHPLGQDFASDIILPLNTIGKYLEENAPKTDADKS